MSGKVRTTWISDDIGTCPEKKVWNSVSGKYRTSLHLVPSSWAKCDLKLATDSASASQAGECGDVFHSGIVQWTMNDFSSVVSAGRVWYLCLWLARSCLVGLRNFNVSAGTAIYVYEWSCMIMLVEGPFLDLVRPLIYLLFAPQIPDHLICFTFSV